MARRKDFRKKDKIQRLLWCDRHCCLCDKACGIDIEIAHIENNDNNDIDNGIPVCYDCHAKISMYNILHPRGTKYKVEEIKARREQIYDKYTRQFVAPIRYIISQDINPFNVQRNSSERPYPDVSFSVTNLSDYLRTRLRIILRGILNDRGTELDLEGPLYSGEKLWNLNPRRIVNGHFKIRNKKLFSFNPSDSFEVRVKIVQTDEVGRDHELLEDGYVYNHVDNYWYFEP